MSPMDVWEVAKLTIDALRDLGMKDVCFIGGVACCVHTNHRKPKDVDILILDAAGDQETIKCNLVNHTSSFYLLDARQPGAKYKVLWYHPHGRRSTGRPHRYGAVKVDILLPGTMDLPALDLKSIDFNNYHQLPIAPLSLVLLHKLRGWHDRLHSNKPYYYKKHPKDALDVKKLLPIAAGAGVKIKADPDLPRKLVNKARRWVNQYVTKYPKYNTIGHWKKIGFNARREQQGVLA